MDDIYPQNVLGSTSAEADLCFQAVPARLADLGIVLMPDSGGVEVRAAPLQLTVTTQKFNLTTMPYETYTYGLSKGAERSSRTLSESL